MPQAVGITYSVASGLTIYAGRNQFSAGTGVNLSELSADLRVFQRVGTSKQVTVSGTCTGSPSLIQARVIDSVTAAPAMDWTTIATDPADDAFSGALTVPQGGWYKLQVRDGVNTALTDEGANRFGVGIVIGMIGQSNMYNRTSTASKSPLGDKRAVQFNRSSAFARIGNINDAQAANLESDQAGYSTPSITLQTDSRGDGFVYLANLVSQGLGVPVCLIERGVSGSAIASWMSGQTNWTAFASAVAAAGGDMEAVAWHQGESDANAMSAATMKLRLADLHGQLHTLTGRDSSTFHFGIIGLGIGSFGGSSEGEFGNMRAAHVQYAAENAGAYLSTSAHDTYTSDGVHLQGLSFSKVGRRDAKSLLARLGVGSSGAGPKITSAARASSLVTVAVTHSGGTSLSDGGGGSGAALTGFQFFDAGAAGAEIAVTASSISGNSILLTLASEPVGSLTMSYAMMNNPHGASATTAPTLASIVYDNATYHGSAIGCPMQPLAAIAVV